MPVSIQRALIDAVESGHFYRIGGEAPITLDVRFLALARHAFHEMPERSADPRFAEWLGCFTLVMSPLRERIDDMPSLIDET